MKSVSEKVQGVIIDKYYFRDPKGRIRKYLQFCIRKLCKTESSYNYENLKTPKYCFKHKKGAFLSIKSQFYDTRYNYIYTDLYFKKDIKDIILKNINDTKYYKSYIIKKNMLNFNYNAELQHYSDKFNSNNIINDINNIENLEKNDEYLKPYLIKNNTDMI